MWHAIILEPGSIESALNYATPMEVMQLNKTA